MKTRFKALICNIVIVCLSVLSIASYFFLPFWKLEVAFTVSAESIQYFTDEEESEESEPAPNPEEGGETGSIGDAFSMENIGEYIGDEKIPVKLSIALETSYILSSYQANADATVQKIIDDNINNLIDQLYEPLNKIMKNALSATSKELLKEQAKEQLKNIYGDEKSDTELEQILVDANVDVDGKVDGLMEKLYADDATVESVSNSIVSTIDEICDELYTYDPEEFADLQLSEDAKTEIKASVEEMLVTFSNEDGSINMDDFVAEMLLKFLNPEESEEGDGSEEAQTSTVRYMSARFSDSTSPEVPEEDAKEQLKTALRSYVTEMIPEGTAKIVVTVMQIIGYVIFFTFFTWFYLILKILVKLGMKNNAIRLGLPIWLGWLPYLVLVILPSAALSVLKDPSMLSFLGEEVVKGLTTATGAMNAFSLNVSFFSCALVSFIVAIAFLLFALFYYGPLRRRLKKIKRGLIVEENDNAPKETPAQEPDQEFNMVVKTNNAYSNSKMNTPEDTSSEYPLEESKE